MAQITLTFPDAVAPRVLDAFAARYGYQAQLLDANDQLIPNPETKAQFARRMVREFVQSVVRQHEADVAAETARRNAIAAATTEVTFT